MRAHGLRLCVARERTHLVGAISSISQLRFGFTQLCFGFTQLRLRFTQLRLLSVGPLGELGLRRAQLRVDEVLRGAAAGKDGEAAAEGPEDRLSPHGATSFASVHQMSPI